MSRPLSRAAVLLPLAALAACSRVPPTPPSGEAAQAETARFVPGAGASRLVPGPSPRTVRPRPPPCLPAPFASAGELADEARRALELGQKQRALDCAEEATRLAPRSVTALAVRADALSALERIPEAQLAYARALAIDADDPVALLGAADLYVRRFPGVRDALETGLEYAARGARAAVRAPHRDRSLAAELQLVAGIAENDLGRNRRALVHLDRAMAGLPEDADVAYERGVALFELCRFEDARRAFERALALSPDNPWALHQLGLVAEQRGDTARAERLFARARALDPKTFAPELPIDDRAFRAQIQRAIGELSPEDRATLAAVPIEVRDLPDPADLLAVDPPLSPAILGLFRGPPEGEPCAAGDGPRCRSIVFYRKNLVRFAHDRAGLEEQIRITLLHELGHLRGEDDDELRDRGLE
ncbi:MAG TPA: metallopeptidase family protein [Anaeromyxobacter sp.]|nr:metallopeptidase family protein [Anaeromyxobacter sp.]